MKYRIRIQTFTDKHQTFLPEVEGKYWGWDSISYRINLIWGGDQIDIWLLTREEALKKIDNHFANTKRKVVKSISFEYITK